MHFSMKNNLKSNHNYTPKQKKFKIARRLYQFVLKKKKNFADIIKTLDYPLI
jgi:hypothetical protein